MQLITSHILKSTKCLFYAPTSLLRTFSTHTRVAFDTTHTRLKEWNRSDGGKSQKAKVRRMKGTKLGGGQSYAGQERILRARKLLATDRARSSRTVLSPYQLSNAVEQTYDELVGDVYGAVLSDKRELASWGVPDTKAFKTACMTYRETLLNNDSKATKLRWELGKVFSDGGDTALYTALKYKLRSYTMSTEQSTEDVRNQKRVADLRYPSEWYPATRAIQRKIFLHVGPTNSGKTYQALQRLENAASGIYAGPLRLLAHEVYSRLNAKGKLCALVTGEERRYPDGYEQVGDTQMISCTVEMVPRHTEVDVAVIDEIQMIGSPDRGWAWTQALLGVKAKEVHLCGEARTVPLIREICAALGEELVVNKYKRLSPLQTMDTALGDYSRLEKGDCLIVFSRVGIHNAKKDIERITKRKCAIVYGSLPPETRAQQAALFNDPDNDYDFLVASDAIGMGLNLSIKRVIFDATSKHNGKEHETLEIAALKQIAGRAGRFKTAHEATTTTNDTKKSEDDKVDSLLDLVPKKTVGLVTAMESFDLPVIRKAMLAEPPTMPSAGLFPPNEIVLRFASSFPPGTPFSFILLRLHEISVMHPRFHLCNLRDRVAIADIIQPYGLSISDMLIFSAAPIPLREAEMIHAVQGMAQALADQTGGELLDIKEINLDILDKDPLEGKVVDGKTLRSYEVLHKILTLYLWLSYRFAGIFRSQAMAFHVKGLVEAKIDAALEQVKVNQKVLQAKKRAREQAAAEKAAELDALVNVPVDEESQSSLTLSG